MDVTAEAAAIALHKQLLSETDLNFVGVGAGDTLFVYLKTGTAADKVPSTFNDFPVEVRVTGEIIPASTGEPARYIIVKNGRIAERTYTGPSWEEAGLQPPTLGNGMARHADYFYTDRQTAQDDADKLSAVNPVGFFVATGLPWDEAVH